MKCVDNPRQLHVLYVSDGGQRVQALSEVLLNRGHRVQQVSSLREILLAEDAHVLVLDVAEREEEHALLMLEEIENAGTELPIVMVSSQRSYELCRSAAEFDVAALIQDAFAPTALTNAVEHCANDQSPDAPARIEHSERYSSDSAGAQESLDDLRSYLEEAHLASAHIARVLVASAEIIDNVQQHAYSAGGEFCLQAEVQKTRRWLRISDEGRCMQQAAAQVETIASALPCPRRQKPISMGAAVVFGGLSRAARLADQIETHNDQQGSSVQLEFELSPVACSAEELPDLSLLAPQSMRALVRSVELKEVSLGELSPVLALTVRRLIGSESGPQRVLKRV